MAEAVMTPDQIRRVKATAPVFQSHGPVITKHFYKRMLDAHPHLNNIFNSVHQQTGAQPNALARAVFGYAANLDNLGALQQTVSTITHKHASLNIQPEHYPIVGHHLLASVKEVLGDAVDDLTLEAWQVAYQLLANIFIEAERALYNSAASIDGWRQFTVAKKEVESAEITSFHLEPVDGNPVPEYKPGQFISIKQFVPELGYEQPRQYSLSTVANTKYLRISVKHEKAQNGKPEGRLSSLLHSEIKVGSQVDVSPPFGDFYLDEKATTPVVLLSGGVGLTPMIAMLESLTRPQWEGAERLPTRKVVFVHGARNKRVHAMNSFLKDIVASNPSVSKSIWYSDVTDAVQGTDYDHEGRIDLEKIQKEVVLESADYFLCGPVAFMTAMEDQLISLGVKSEKIHSEVFGVKE